jgi:hypothetical protein
MKMPEKSAVGAASSREEEKIRAKDGAPTEERSTVAVGQERSTVTVGAAFSRESSPPQIHATRLVVWDVPPAIERGTPFRVKLGVKCASQCGAHAWQVEVRDDEGRTVATASVSEAPWPGTALHVADVELRAPDADGLFAWQARVPYVEGDGSAGPAHEAAAASFNVRAVPAPECLLKVLAVDARTRAPVEGAKVVAHPYRGVTGADGIAELRVSKGAYRLFVSGRDYVPFRADGNVEADTSITAALALDLGPSDAELWS